jgi:hypothetical protein
VISLAEVLEDLESAVEREQQRAKIAMPAVNGNRRRYFLVHLTVLLNSSASLPEL